MRYTTRTSPEVPPRDSSSEESATRAARQWRRMEDEASRESAASLKRALEKK